MRLSPHAPGAFPAMSDGMSSEVAAKLLDGAAASSAMGQAEANVYASIDPPPPVRGWGPPPFAAFVPQALDARGTGRNTEQTEWPSLIFPEWQPEDPLIVQTPQP